MVITEEELKIFSRQLILGDFNEKNFEYIQQQHVVVIGLGGIGCPTALYLVASGVKNLTLIDDDIIKLSNLNRQILYSQNDLGRCRGKVCKRHQLVSRY